MLSMLIKNINDDLLGSQIKLNKVVVSEVLISEYKSGKGYTVKLVLQDGFDSENFVQAIKFINKSYSKWENDYKFYSNLKIGELVELEGKLDKIDKSNEEQFKYVKRLKIKSVKINVAQEHFLIKVDNMKTFSQNKFDNEGNLIPPNNVKSVDKRVEINIYTKGSAYNSIVDLEKLKDETIKRGVTSIGITDFGNMSYFPMVEKVFKDSGVKVLLGTEINFSDKNGSPFIHNKNKMNGYNFLNGIPFVIYDFETSGLNALLNEIIEIGAIKCVYDIDKEVFIVLDEFSILIKPKKPITEKIIEITNITNEMLNESEINEKEGLEKFYNFIGDCEVLVGHNVEFDYDFLKHRTKVNKITFSEEKYSTFCTMLLSDLIFRRTKKAVETNISNLEEIINDKKQLDKMLKQSILNLTLENVVKKYKFDIENHHRALNDTKTTLKVLEKMILGYKKQKSLSENDYLNYHIYGLKQLKSLTFESIERIYEKEVDNRFPTSMLIYAKNQKGLETLYDLLTLNNIDYNKGRTLPLNIILENRENLILVSNGLKSDITKNLLKGSINKNSYLKYDYIGLHDSYGTEFDIDVVKLINQNLYKTAKNNNKKVLYLGNVRYLKKNEKFYYDFMKNEFYKGKNNNIRRTDFNKNNYKNDKLFIDSFSVFFGIDVINEIIDNSVYFSNEFENVTVINNELNIPKIDGSKEYIIDYALKTMKEKYGDNPPKVIVERLNYEIEKTLGKFAPLYYVTHMIIVEALLINEIIESRGSVGGSLLAYFTKITDLNPLKPHYYCAKCKTIDFVYDDKIRSGYDLDTKKCEKCNCDLKGDGHDLLFEIFVGFDGNKTPDIDLNFSSNYQTQAHKNIEKYVGKGNVVRFGNVNKLSGDTIRKLVFDFHKKELTKNRLYNVEVLGIATKDDNSFFTKKDFFYVDYRGKVTKVPFVVAKNNYIEVYYLETKTNGEKGTKKITTEVVQKYVLPLNNAYINNIIYVLKDVRTNIGTHAGGSGIKADGTKFPFSLAYSSDGDKEETIVTQVGYKDFEDSILKMDLLGHGNPLKLKKIVELTDVKLSDISFNLDKVYEAFLKGETEGISEFNTTLSTQATMDILQSIVAKGEKMVFSHLVDISNLTHGTGVYEGNMKDLLEQGKSILEIPSSREMILSKLQKNIDTNTSFKIMEGVRKGKGMKDEDIKLLKNNGIEDWYIDSMLKIEYLFTKAHATAYVQSAYYLMYFKIYHTVSYIKASLDREVQKSRNDFYVLFDLDKEKKEKLIEKIYDMCERDKTYELNEAETDNIKMLKIIKYYLENVEGHILKPSLNKSDNDEVLIDGQNLLLPLKVINGLDIKLIDKINKYKEEHGEITKEDLRKITDNGDMVLILEKFI